MTFHFLLLAVAAGQTQTVLTEEAAVEKALQHNLDIAALRYAHKAAELAPKGVGLLASPQVRLGVTDVAAELNDPDRKRNNVGLAWSPPKWGEMRLKAVLAATRTEEVASELAAAEQRVAAEVRVIYRNLAIAEAQWELAREAVRLRERILAVVREQVTGGVRGALDRSNAELALAEAQAAPEQWNAERAVHRLRLSQKTGIRSEEIAVAAPQDWYSYRAAAADRPALLREAFANRPELRSAAARCEAAGQALVAARKALYPSLGTVQVFRRTNREDSPGSWGFQVSVELPVFQWFENGVAAADAQLEQCRTKRRAVERSIAAEIDELLARMGAVSAELTGFRQSAIELSGHHVDIARTELAAGQTDKVEPLTAQLRVVSVKQAFLAKLQELRVLEAGLRQATAHL